MKYIAPTLIMVMVLVIINTSVYPTCVLSNEVIDKTSKYQVYQEQYKRKVKVMRGQSS